jgi:hypothetical protein
VKASEKDLSRVNLGEGSTPTGSADFLKGSSGSMTKKSSDGQSDVSQVVSWKAGFVDNYSEVSKSLNISGT